MWERGLDFSNCIVLSYSYLVLRYLHLLLECNHAYILTSFVFYFYLSESIRVRSQTPSPVNASLHSFVSCSIQLAVHNSIITDETFYFGLTQKQKQYG